MYTVQGKVTVPMEATTFAAHVARYSNILVDLGTGDGRYARHTAQARPDWLVVGVDACREQLHPNSRRALPNLLFVVANAYTLPPDLSGLATRLTINFPWGSLLAGLVAGDPSLLSSVRALVRPGATVDVALNGGALAEVGATLEEGGPLVCAALEQAGFVVKSPVVMDAAALRAWPTTWAHRLAFGRDPRGLLLRAREPAGSA
jgi:16S rRNA (adenine(1408)-N(1))-methyltransferase